VNKTRIAAALKAVPGTRGSIAPQANGLGRISPIQSEMYYNNPYRNTYGPFLPRQPETFSDGAFGPMPPIQPVPVDQPPMGGQFPDPRWWQYTQGWNLPTPPGSEGLKLASFDQLKMLSEKYCLSPVTRVLCSDFIWRPLTEISVGDELIAFDEQAPKNKYRKFRRAVVTDYDKIIRPSYRINFTDGREVVASAEHLWLSGPRNGGRYDLPGRDCEVCGKHLNGAQALGAHRRLAHGIEGWWKQTSGGWIPTAELRPGDSIRDLGKPWESDSTYDAGYLGGFADGEASFNSYANGGFSVTFPQLAGPVFDRVEKLLKNRGHQVAVYGPDKHGMKQAKIHGAHEVFRFLGECDPIRLSAKAADKFEGTAFNKCGNAVIESIEFLGEQEVIALGTSTKTLIAEGLFSHNSVARSCIELRIDEVLGLGWEIGLTKEAAKAYQGDHHANREAGEKIGVLTKFFKRPDPDYLTFNSFLAACLEEVFVYDALALIMRPKFGEQFGMGGRGLLGSPLESLRLVSGPTIRPLLDLHGGHPAPPNPAFQQFLYGVPRSDYPTLISGFDLDDSALAGSEYNSFSMDVMRYAPLWSRRETPYGFPPIERALLPIISGLQKQEYQLDYFTEGSVPAVYISPGDANITATQVKELQDALNGIAGDPAFHMKVVVLPPGSKVEPQRPVDLSDGFDQLVMTQVCMAFDVQPIELGILPNIGGGQQSGPSSSAIRMGSQEARDVKSRKSTKPLLHYLADIFNYIIQDVCHCEDLQFQFEGLTDEEDKQSITELGVQQVQNGIASIDEVRDRLDLAPWGLSETSEPVVFTAQGPIPFSMAPQLIAAAMGGGQSGGGNNGTQGTNSGQRTSSSRSTSKQPTVRAGGQTKPNGSHQAPVSPHRESLTPAHSAAGGAVQSSTPRTGGTPSRSSVAGSRKKAVEAELSSLGRHLRKGRDINTWEPLHISAGTLGSVTDFLAQGYLTDVALRKAGEFYLAQFDDEDFVVKVDEAPPMWPGWGHDLQIVDTYKGLVADAFKAADVTATQLRQKAATGQMFVSGPTLRGLISDGVHDTFMEVLKPLWAEAYSAGYASGKFLVTGEEPDFDTIKRGSNLQNFVETEGTHWLDQISRTGLKDVSARIPMIARTEVARAMNAGAIQSYRDNNVQYKHLLIAPDDTCDICKAAEAEGDIPLDAIFPSGGLGGPLHVQCRCIPAPAGVDLVPPQAKTIKGVSWQEDDHVVSWLLLRARGEDGKYRFLLQQRDDGSWGMPGGHAHLGEDPWAAALREATEEIGDLPGLTLVRDFNHIENDGVTRAFLYLCDTAYFRPELNGSTPEETRGTGWFRRKEIDDLKLVAPFREDWFETVRLRDYVTKHQIVTENGEQLTVSDPGQPLYPAGARWPYPHRSDGAEEPHYGTAETPEPPYDDLSSGTHPRVYEDDDTDEFPKRRGTHRGPESQVQQRGKLPADTDGGVESGLSSPEAGTGVPPSGRKAAPVPVVGMKPPMAPKPGNPRSVPPVVNDPGDAVERWSDEDESDVIVPQSKKKSVASDVDLANPSKPGGPADYSDPNPVDSEHIYVQMAKNFPADAIEWVKRAKWVGPVWVPWDRVDTDDEDKWAASHQSSKVNEFAKLIREHKGHVAPSILVQESSSNKAFIVDGHHRSLAHRKLGQKVLAYLGNIDPRDRMAAMETHSKQFHSGSDPKNV
jgi:8-oxo-dGTP pyrophosphatase MutT (NUDIX family)